MTTAIDIRTASKDDLPSLIKIFSHPDLKTSTDEARWFVNCYFDYHHLLVAEISGKIQGACLWRIEGERYSGLGWIENLWVEERYRKLGLGEKLLMKAVSDIIVFFEGHGIKPRKIVLTTQAERADARRLYEKIGLKHVASIDGMYDPGGHDMVYMLDLSEWRSRKS